MRTYHPIISFHPINFLLSTRTRTGPPARGVLVPVSEGSFEKCLQAVGAISWCSPHVTNQPSGTSNEAKLIIYIPQHSRGPSQILVSTPFVLLKKILMIIEWFDFWLVELHENPTSHIPRFWVHSLWQQLGRHDIQGRMLRLKGTHFSGRLGCQLLRDTLHQHLGKMWWMGIVSKGMPMSEILVVSPVSFHMFM